jgi:DNA-directed RNA polymerase specialized sigma24 family protein
MLGASKITRQEATPYATGADFCRIFKEDMNRLYLLSFLLTADHSTAEKCFVRGLEDSRKANSVFKEWAQSWARRTIIQNAIRMIRPRPDGSASGSISDRGARHATTPPEEIAGIVELPAFERFAFVMSVLEGYADRECSLLLDCTVGDLIAARTRALQQISGSAELHGKLAGIDSDQLLGDPAFQQEVISHLAASA